MKWIAGILGGLLVLLGAAFLVFRVPDTDARTMWAKYGAAPSRTLQLEDGRTIHIRDEGPRDAPVIVLLHGSNADLHTWQPWSDALTDDYRVIRYDQRGHGLTGPAPDGDYSLDGFVRDVDAVTEALGVESFVLAGNSMGGWIAAGYAMRNPERLKGLVLVDAGGAPVEHEGGGNLAFKLAAMPGVGTALSQLLPRSLVEKSLSQSVSNQTVVTDAAVDRYWELARYPGNRAATGIRFATPRKPFRAEDVARIEMPVLVMWGEEDALIPFEAARWYETHLPHATLVAYPGVGHIPMEEAPERSAGDLRRWLGATLGTPDPVPARDGPPKR